MRLPLRYLAGSFLARFAEEGMGVTVTLLAVQRTGSVTQAAAVSAAWLAPHVLAAPAVGSLASRARTPGRFYALGLLVVAATIGTVSLLLGRIPLLAVCVVATLGGCCGPVVSGGLSSLIADLVPERHRDRAYGWDSATYNAASIGGTGAATAIAAIWAAGLAGLMLTAAAGAAAVLIALLPRTRRSSTAAGVWAGMIVGLTALWRQRTLRAVTAATCLAYLGIGGLTITAVLTARRWGDGDGGGVLLTAFAIGALAAALTLARWTPPMPPQRLASYSLVLTGVCLGLATLAPSLGICVILFALAGAGDGPLLSATLRIRATHAPPTARAQVFTTGAALKLSAAAVGAGLAGAFESLPAALPLTLIAATQLTACVLMMTVAPGPRHDPDTTPRPTRRDAARIDP